MFFPSLPLNPTIIFGFSDRTKQALRAEWFGFCE